MAGGFRADDYIDVAERVATFYNDHPEGRIQTEFVGLHEVAGKSFVMFKATVWRTVDDPLPSIGYAWEPVPGLTNFTKNSEAMNAETSAIGRAIVWLNAHYSTKRDGTRSIASANEVRNRQNERTTADDTNERVAGEVTALRVMLRENGIPGGALGMTVPEVEAAIAFGSTAEELFAKAKANHEAKEQSNG